MMEVPSDIDELLSFPSFDVAHTNISRHRHNCDGGLEIPKLAMQKLTIDRAAVRMLRLVSVSQNLSDDLDYLGAFLG